jgi:hypothetical protein
MAADDAGARCAHGSRRRAERSAQIVAGAAGAFSVVAGVWAFAAPEAFFDAAATFSPYNEHLIRDIGAFQLGLGMILLLSIAVADAAVVALGGVGIGSLVHAVGHVIDRDLGGNPGVDIPFFGVLSLLLIAIAWVRWRSLRRTA